jgi:Na+/H+ antiporter NhaD/arsenite permease-like protein
MDFLEAIDFEVLILLASIMIVNHLVVHLKETKRVILYLQTLVQQNPHKGFWMISFAAFIASPFLTNDGVCLLFVEPILNSFDHCITQEEDSDNTPSDNSYNISSLQIQTSKKSTLLPSDALYFLLGLAPLANIGSSLTYTGDPRNMIVATDAIHSMPPYKFLVYMLLPVMLSWLVSKYCYQEQ